MLGPIISFNRLAVISVVFVIICVLVLSTTSGLREHGNKIIEDLKDQAKEAANNVCNNDRPMFGKPTIGDSFLRLYEEIRSPVAADVYIDPAGKEYEVSPDAPWWKESLRNEVLIVDIDTRVPNGKNELWHEGRMNWDGLETEGSGGMVSASFMNHFLYGECHSNSAKIHGYDYKFFNAKSMGDGVHNTWVKPHVLHALLQSYKFVIFIDADATIQHLEVPVEWLFNRWGITPQTSIAMPLDTRQTLKDSHTSEDSKGRLMLNSGVIVAQALPHTMKMMTAWKDCPDEKRYKGCGQWKDQWAHEQRAFSEYIRYDFNPNGTNIVEIPCNDAMGYPGIKDHDWINSNCKGQFIRHHTIDKGLTKKSTEAAMLQSFTDLLRKELLSKKKEYWIKESEYEPKTGNEPTIPGL